MRKKKEPLEDTIVMKAFGLAEELLAVEMLEYHNKNWLGQDDAIRSRRKQQLLKELLGVLNAVKCGDDQVPTINKDVFLRP